jgi:hypothetical protein
MRVIALKTPLLRVITRPRPFGSHIGSIPTEREIELRPICRTDQLPGILPSRVVQPQPQSQSALIMPFRAWSSPPNLEIRRGQSERGLIGNPGSPMPRCLERAQRVEGRPLAVLDMRNAQPSVK